MHSYHNPNQRGMNPSTSSSNSSGGGGAGQAHARPSEGERTHKEWPQASAWREMDARSAPFTIPTNRDTSPTANFLAHHSTSPPQVGLGESVGSSSTQSFSRFTSPPSIGLDARSPSPVKRNAFGFGSAAHEARDRWTGSIGQAQQQPMEATRAFSTSNRTAGQPSTSQGRTATGGGGFGGNSDAFLGYGDIWGTSGGNSGTGHRPGYEGDARHTAATAGGVQGSQRNVGPASLDQISTNLDQLGLHRDEASAYSAVGPGRSLGQEATGFGGFSSSGMAGLPPFPSSSGLPSSDNMSPRSMMQLHQQMQAVQAQGHPISHSLGGAPSMSQSSMSGAMEVARNGEEITTVFIVGFPDDMTEREFANMFLFAKGFEASTLKVPPGINAGAAASANAPSVGPLRPGEAPGSGPGGPYSAVNMTGGPGMFDMHGANTANSSGWDEHGMPIGMGRAGSVVEGYGVLGGMAPGMGQAGPGDRGSIGGASSGPPGKIKQIIGFAKFRTRSEALEARDALNGRKIDAERGCVLKTEMAKKNLHTKQRPVLSSSGGPEGGAPPFPPPPSSGMGGPPPPNSGQGGAGAFGPMGMPPPPPGHGAMGGGAHQLSNVPGGAGHHANHVHPATGRAGPMLSPGAFSPHGQAGLANGTANSFDMLQGRMPYNGAGGNGPLSPSEVSAMSGQGGLNGFSTSNRSFPDPTSHNTEPNANGKWSGSGPLDFFVEGANGHDATYGQPSPSHQDDALSPSQRDQMWPAIISSNGPPNGFQPIAFGDIPAQHLAAPPGSSAPKQGLVGQSNGHPAPLVSNGPAEAHNIAPSTLQNGQANAMNLHSLTPAPSANGTHPQATSVPNATSDGKRSVPSTIPSPAPVVPMAAPLAAHAGPPTPASTVSSPQQAPMTNVTQPANGHIRPQSRLSNRASSPPISVGSGTASRFGSLRIDSPMHNQRPFSPHSMMRSPPPFLDPSGVLFRATSPGSPPISSPTSRSFSIDANPPGNTLFVGNLPASINAPPASTQLEDALFRAFSGKVGFRQMSFRVKGSGPMCFIEFDDVGCAGRALGQLNGDTLDGMVKGGLRLSFSKHPLFKGTSSASSHGGSQTPSTGGPALATNGNGGGIGLHGAVDHGALRAARVASPGR